MFANFSERNISLVRWALVCGWFVVIFSLFYNPLESFFAFNGKTVFWSIAIPLVPVFLMIFGHEAWRRICPLSALMQIPRNLGIQLVKTRFNSKTGMVDRNLHLIHPGSWLARNHWMVQFGILFVGLCLRILLINSESIALGIFFLVLILSAVSIGFYFGGKTWCHYFCPLAPVQKIYSEPGGLLESRAYDSQTNLSKSMCRTISPYKTEVSACVGCTQGCPDIDLEKQYWQQIESPGRKLTYYGYFGLILGFYAYFWLYSGSWNYYFSGDWTRESDLFAILYRHGFHQDFYWIPGLELVPRILAVPLVLSGFVLAGYLFWTMVERIHKKITVHPGKNDQSMAQHQIFCTISFLSVNIFYLVGAYPVLSSYPFWLRSLLQFLVVFMSTVWLWQVLSRSKDLYKRESIVKSLLKQLKNVDFDFSQVLEGRSLDDLKVDEIYVLAKTLPSFSHGKRREIYKGLLREFIESGKSNPAQSLETLREIRDQIGVSDAEHGEILLELGVEDASFLDLDRFGEEGDRLRLRSFRESVEALIKSTMRDYSASAEDLLVIGEPSKENEYRGENLPEEKDLELFTMSLALSTEGFIVLVGDVNAHQREEILRLAEIYEAPLVDALEILPGPGKGNSSISEVHRGLLNKARAVLAIRVSHLKKVLTSCDQVDVRRLFLVEEAPSNVDSSLQYERVLIGDLVPIISELSKRSLAALKMAGLLQEEGLEVGHERGELLVEAQSLVVSEIQKLRSLYNIDSEKCKEILNKFLGGDEETLRKCNNALSSLLDIASQQSSLMELYRESENENLELIDKELELRARRVCIELLHLIPSIKNIDNQIKVAQSLFLMDGQTVASILDSDQRESIVDSVQNRLKTEVFKALQMKLKPRNSSDSPEDKVAVLNFGFSDVIRNQKQPLQILEDISVETDPGISSIALSALSVFRPERAKELAQHLLMNSSSLHWLKKETANFVCGEFAPAQTKTRLSLKVIIKGASPKIVEFTKNHIKIGAGRENDLVLSHPSVSQQHVLIYEHNDEFWVKDLGSLLGTSIEKNHLFSQSFKLGDGNGFYLGNSKMDPEIVLQMGSLTEDQEFTVEPVPTMSKVLMLSRVPMFQNIPVSMLPNLARDVEVRRYVAGAPLFHRGEPAQDMYVLQEGAAQAVVDTGNHEKIVGKISAGEVIGELGVLTYQKRSASIKISSDYAILIVVKGDLLHHYIEQESYIGKSILITVCERLQKMVASVG
jgi:hypothetical protein